MFQWWQHPNPNFHVFLISVFCFHLHCSPTGVCSSVTIIIANMRNISIYIYMPFSVALLLVLCLSVIQPSHRLSKWTLDGETPISRLVMSWNERSFPYCFLCGVKGWVWGWGGNLDFSLLSWFSLQQDKNPWAGRGEESRLAAVHTHFVEPAFPFLQNAFRPSGPD